MDSTIWRRPSFRKKTPPFKNHAVRKHRALPDAVYFYARKRHAVGTWKLDEIYTCNPAGALTCGIRLREYFVPIARRD